MNANEIRERAEDVQAGVEETAQTLKDKAAQWQQQAKQSAAELAKRTDAYVHDHVWSTICVTAVLAFTLGVLVARRGD